MIAHECATHRESETPIARREFVRFPMGCCPPLDTEGKLMSSQNNSGRVPFSVVVPARNEELTISAILERVRTMTDDLIVVDGHSDDKTVEVSKSFGARVIQDNGRGKGDAVRVALQFVKHPITVFIDADGSHNPNDIHRLVAPIAAGEADLVMGSRMLGGSDELFGSIPEVIRLMGSLVISLTINYRFGLRLTDYQNGLRAIRTDVARAIGLKSNITTIEQEMGMKALRYRFRVIEVPTHEFSRQGGATKIHVWRVAHKYIWSLVTGVFVFRRPRPDLPQSPIVTEQSNRPLEPPADR